MNNSRKILRFDNSTLYRLNIEYCLSCRFLPEREDENYYMHYDEEGFGVLRSHSYWFYIKDSLYPVTLRYIIGYLSLKGEMNHSIVEQLDFVAHKLIAECSVDFQYYHKLLKEGSSSQFSVEFMKFLQNVLWSFTSACVEPLYYAKRLLQYVTPNEIHLHCCRRLKANSWKFLSNCIQTVKTCNSNIHLDLSNIFGCPNNYMELIKGLLTELLNEAFVARLVTLHSPLDKEGIKLLETAAYLKEISMKVSANDLPVIAEVLRKLPSLQKLRMAIDAASYGSLDHTNLNVGHENLSDFVIVLLETYHLQPQVVGELLSNISPYVKHVILSGSVVSLTEDRFLNYVTFIKSNLKSIQQIDFMLDITAAYAYQYFLSCKDLGQYLINLHPDVVIQVKEYWK